MVDEKQPSTGTREPEGASDRAPSKARLRTCVGCGEREDAAAGHDVLVRLVLAPDGAVVVDAADGALGRGAHVHPRPGCIRGAASRGLPRASKRLVHLGHDGASPNAPNAPNARGPAPLSAEELAGAMVAALDRRIAGLLIAAGRAGALALGADAAKDACERDEAHLLVVACDASVAADLVEVRRAIAEGRAVAWGTKASLSQLVSPSTRAQEVGIVGVKRDALARELRAAVHARDACAGTPLGPPSGGGGRVRGRWRAPRPSAGSNGSVSRAEVATAATPGRSLAERGA